MDLSRNAINIAIQINKIIINDIFIAIIIQTDSHEICDEFVAVIVLIVELFDNEPQIEAIVRLRRIMDIFSFD
jgi:hypothetical protein